MLVTPATAPPPRKAFTIDFEFRADPGERPLVWCLAVRDVFTGVEQTYWRDDLLSMRFPPFDIGPDTAIVGYYASAEWGCFVQLGWPLPAQPIDLFAEVRVTFNRHLPKELRKPGTGDRWGLYDALSRYDLETGESAHKTAMRELAMAASLGSWTDRDKQDLMHYCADDVRRTADLFLAMYPDIDWPQARLRGLYTAAVGAIIEHEGIPIDGPLFRRLSGVWDSIKARYISEIEATYNYQFHVGGSFNHGRFMDWLAAEGMTWQFTGTGSPKLDDDTFREMERRYPQLGSLRRLFSHILEMKVTSLPVGVDDRNRCLSSVFATVTGRTMPSSAKHIWGQTRWIRGLIRPPEGYGLAVLDWKAQEYAITAALSGDSRMIDDYQKEDPYWAFAVAAHLCGADAAIDKKLRGQCKVICLGIPYGMTEHAAAAQLGVSLPYAHTLIRLHKATYHVADRWVQNVVHRALVDEIMATKFGWKWRCVPYQTAVGYDFPTARSIRNFYCQANGADMMRGAVVSAWLAGIRVVSTMHDALMIVAPLTGFDHAVAVTRQCMVEAGRALTGFGLRVDVHMVRWPDRFMDEGGAATWKRTMGILREVSQ